jgi:carboxynorspermidine decarboxylase
MAVNFDEIPSPCFVLDEQALDVNLKKILYVMEQAGVEIIPALKGFAMWAAFPRLKEYVNSASASSLYEAKLIFEELGKEAHIYSPAYQPGHFDEILDYCHHVIFNSYTQFELFKPFIDKKNKTISAGLRINPGWSPVSTELYNPCSIHSRLGIPLDVFIRNVPKDIEGIHVHNLCESGSKDSEKTVNIIRDRLSDLLLRFKWINLGGGHLITRKGYDLEHLISVLKTLQEQFHGTIYLEPGSAFAWETGYLVSTVLDVVDYVQVKTAILDVSFTAHMPDTLEMPYQPSVIGASKTNNGGIPYRLGGNSCLAGDFIGNWWFKNDLQPGDKIVFEDMIHYTMVKTTMFNGIHHPSIGIWKNDDTFDIVREFGYKDYKERLS